MLVELKCKAHPEYKGTKKPKKECSACEILRELRRKGQVARELVFTYLLD